MLCYVGLCLGGSQPENAAYTGGCIWARKSFGGVGIFVKHEMYERYTVLIEFKDFDDMLGVLFRDKNTNYCFMVYSLYLPPEMSTVYNNAPEFF